MSERFLTANMRASVISEMNLMEIYTEMEHGINIWLQKEGTSHVDGPSKRGSHCTDSQRNLSCCESPDKRENYVN